MWVTHETPIKTSTVFEFVCERERDENDQWEKEMELGFLKKKGMGDEEGRKRWILGTGGAMGLLRWFEKAESVFAMCNCPEGDRVKYATGTLEDDALTWWNAKVQILGIEMIIRLAHKITDQEVERGSLPPRISATTPAATATTPANDNKRKWNDADKATSASQSQKRPDNNNNPSFSQSSSVNQGKGSNQSQGSYVGRKPKCNKCGYHHHGPCVQAYHQCDKCGDEGHIKRDCPQLNQNANDNNNRQNNNNNAGNNNNGNNGGNGARGRVFTIGAGDARNDGNVVTGTFTVNNLFASVLFDSGADLSYVSLEFSQRLGLTPTPLEAKHAVELADGKTIEASHVFVGCRLDLVSQVFDIDLLPVTLGSFDVVVGMDWLSKHQAEILCKEKIVRIPLPSGEFLSVQGHPSGAMLGIILAMQAHKCL
ncbi:myb-like protein A [Helianthus annuus]|uniref:myb-like protein A n=1 Tax=Helianthus annuus TaxID=4232 RepID=UPI000B8FECE6|nr:myb-like protein A [Helianthus annuus]